MGFGSNQGAAHWYPGVFWPIWARKKNMVLIPTTETFTGLKAPLSFVHSELRLLNWHGFRRRIRRRQRGGRGGCFYQRWQDRSGNREGVEQFFRRFMLLFSLFLPLLPLPQTKRTLRLPRHRFNNFLAALPSETG